MVNEDPQTKGKMMKNLVGELGQGRKVSSAFELELARVKKMKAQGQDPYKNQIHVV